MKCPPCPVPVGCRIHAAWRSMNAPAQASISNGINSAPRGVIKPSYFYGMMEVQKEIAMLPGTTSTRSTLQVLSGLTANQIPGVNKGQEFIILRDTDTGDEIGLGLGGIDDKQILFVRRPGQEEYRVTDKGTRNPAFVQAAASVLELNPEMLAKLLELKDHDDKLKNPSGPFEPPAPPTSPFRPPLNGRDNIIPPFTQMPFEMIAVEKWQKAYSTPGVSYGQTYTLIRNIGTGDRIALGMGGEEHNQILFAERYGVEMHRLTKDGERNPQFLATVLNILSEDPELLAKITALADSNEGKDLPGGEGPPTERPESVPFEGRDAKPRPPQLPRIEIKPDSRKQVY